MQKKGRALATKEPNPPKKAKADATKKQYVVPKTSLSKEKILDRMAQDDPQEQSSEDLDASSDDKQKPHHLEQDKQPED